MLFLSLGFTSCGWVLGFSCFKVNCVCTQMCAHVYTHTHTRWLFTLTTSSFPTLLFHSPLSGFLLRVPVYSQMSQFSFDRVLFPPTLSDRGNHKKDLLKLRKQCNFSCESCLLWEEPVWGPWLTSSPRDRIYFNGNMLEGKPKNTTQPKCGLVSWWLELLLICG